MKCEKCHINEATVFITQKINGETVEMNLCDTCAVALEQPIIEDGLSFEQFLTGLMVNNKSNQQHDVHVCNTCGMSLQEFKRNSKVGCADCYKNFGEELLPIVKRLHGTVEHNGKVPGRINAETQSQKNIELLEGQLKVALMQEAYEQAASLRDRIRDLKRGEDL